jgi:hypothetical protein
MASTIKTAVQAKVFTIDGALYRPAAAEDIAAGYPHGNIAANVGKRIGVFVPLLPSAAEVSAKQ